MALSIKDPEADRLARELAKRTGTTITEAVIDALKARLRQQKIRSEEDRKEMVRKAMEIAKECAALPDYDTRSPDEIIGYDENGLPT